jgi:hypothetical protein
MKNKPAAADGKPTVAVQEAEDYQRLLDIAARADAKKGIQQGLEDTHKGRMRPMEERSSSRNLKPGTAWHHRSFCFPSRLRRRSFVPAELSQPSRVLRACALG